MALDPKIWGPHYWFVLHTIALSYPETPNDVVKKKYYDFIQNLPLFIPVQEIGNTFSSFLDRYPVTPYLDSRQSFIRWMHFIHNKINQSLGVDEKSMIDSMTEYYENYKPKIVKNQEQRNRREKTIFIATIIILSIVFGYLYTK